MKETQKGRYCSCVNHAGNTSPPGSSVQLPWDYFIPCMQGGGVFTLSLCCLLAQGFSPMALTAPKAHLLAPANSKEGYGDGWALDSICLAPSRFCPGRLSLGVLSQVDLGLTAVLWTDVVPP